MVVTKIAGVIRIKAAFRRYDLVEVPIPRGQRGRTAGFGDGNVKRAPVRVEIHILVADDETPDLIVINDDRVGQTGAAVGMGQASGAKPEVA
jgi:hypothetical protein